MKRLFAAIVLLLLATSAFAQRTCLTGDQNYYAATGGSDTTGDGSAGSPWATPNTMIKWVQNHVDLCGHKVTLNISGDACQPFTVIGPFVGVTDLDSVTIMGNQINPTLCPITNTSGEPAIYLRQNASIAVNGVLVSSTVCGSQNHGSGIIVEYSRLYLMGLWFGSACFAHLQAIGNMTHVAFVSNNVIIYGNASYGFLAEDKAQVNLNNARIQYFISVTYHNDFAHADQASVIDFTGASFVYYNYSVSGRQFFVEQNALIRLGGNVLPGTTAGATDTYGTTCC